MTGEALSILKDVITNSRLAVVKLEVNLIKDDLLGENVYLLEVTGVSKRGKSSYTTYPEFPLTEKGLARATALQNELKEWR